MRQWSAGFIIVLTLLVPSCSGTKTDAPAKSSTDQPAITGQPADFNADDVAFVTDMIASYNQTSALTALVPTHSTDPAVIALAANIDAAQLQDLQTMKVFLVQWNSNSDSGNSQAAPAGAVPGTVDGATMAGLASLSGKGFDVPWLRVMIGHQQGAVETAQAEVAKGVNVDAKATAKRLVGTYQAQIATMQQLVTR